MKGVNALLKLLCLQFELSNPSETCCSRRDEKFGEVEAETPRWLPDEANHDDIPQRCKTYRAAPHTSALQLSAPLAPTPATARSRVVPRVEVPTVLELRDGAEIIILVVAADRVVTLAIVLPRLNLGKKVGFALARSKRVRRRRGEWEE